MFDLLKKKIGSFIKSFSHKEEDKVAEEPVKETNQLSKDLEKETLTQKKELSKETFLKKEKTEEGHLEEKKPTKDIQSITTEVKQESFYSKSELTQELTQETIFQEQKNIEREPEAREKFSPSFGIFKKIKSVFSNEITIGEEDCRELFEELKLSLLESDVSIDTSEFIANDLKKRIVGKKVAKNFVKEEVKTAVEETLLSLFNKEKNVFSDIAEKKSLRLPYVILFVGPNGQGKTTTVARLAFKLKEKGFSCVFSASDTFRAAALEQLEEHGKNLGIKVIKHKYNADPAAVAFDAISHAKANNIDVVLIDTAGRQETSHNLIKEMEKMNRVIKPDLKIFVAEAIAGHSLVEQVKKFSQAIGIDGIILTKMDCDAKGGTALSIAYETQIPILFVGLGQKYEDLMEFDKNWFIKKILQ